MAVYSDGVLGAYAHLYWNREWANTAPSYYINPDWVEACLVRDLSVLGTRKETDVSIWGQDFRAVETSLENATISFDYLYKARGETVQSDDAFFVLLLQSWMDGQKFEVLVTDLVYGAQSPINARYVAQGLRTAVQVAKMDWIQPLAGVQLLRVALRQSWYPDGPDPPTTYHRPVWWQR